MRLGTARKHTLKKSHKPPRIPESAVQKQAIQFLGHKKFPVYRINCGAIRDSTGRPVKMAPKGFSDVIAVIPILGRFFAIEIKAPGCLSGLTDAQRTFLETIAGNGGVGIVIDDIRTLERVMDELESDPYAKFTIYGEVITP